VPEQPAPVLSEDELKALVRVAEADGDFLSRRDAAIIRLFADTGARLSEIAELDVRDVDVDGGTISVLGKGRRVRNLPIGSRSVRALDRYLAVRGRHPDHDLPRLWLGTQGPLTAYGISELVKRRAKQVGIGAIHVHQLRHSAAISSGSTGWTTTP
jgi:site-specific recombinase XerC